MRDDDDALATSRRPSILQVVPVEMIAMIMAFLDGTTLLSCSLVCRTMTKLSYDRPVWKNICMKEWPTLRTQVLPQLPGAPDYDLIRLYSGCWRRCFVERHQACQRAELRVEIPNFHVITDEKVVSDTFAIGEHRFCLWVFPNGNPNENEYSGKVLSVYLVLTDLKQRAEDWLTCAVFSLSVVNHDDTQKRIEWHSCLVDNKFDQELHNWGVHSLGSLKTLRDPSNGFLRNNTLTVTAKVRLMSITFRVVFEKDLKEHHNLGLVDLSRVESIVLPFCSSLQDLLIKLQDDYNLSPDRVNIWCFNQPVVSGQALRPRKLLTHAKVNRAQPMFGNLLCDGVDIDAYSFCQIYVESKEYDDEPLDNRLSTDAAVWTESDSASTSGYLFIKMLNPFSDRLEYIGRISFSDSLTTARIYQCVVHHLRCMPSALLMYKEEIAPTVFSGPIPWSEDLLVKNPLEFALQPADVVVFVPKSHVGETAFPSLMRSLLWSQYKVAEDLLNRPYGVPTLEMIENLAEKLDIPKFRVRSAFRKCQEDGRNTLRYIMEGRHLGFICDSCGETDFTGPRYNCTMCSDYDLCQPCNAQCHEVNHRYANVDGKWHRIFDFKDHKGCHRMREMLPAFYRYSSHGDNTTSDNQQHQ
ncbi:TPA: hypothetical protein N0F65_003860 [Lagenidium giganteum]|uniref:Uncharacterized protein n=1 Tax=Lagenidium giganteum TaxID=4803 RepID=A0AAV2ZF72_9STRA|nr:TPA: hypothetical protein N0F65_003860 [Lagenidium giganteum]